MAKKGKKGKTLQEQLDAYSRSLDTQRERGFTYSLDAINGVYANLATTTSGLAATLTTETQRSLNALQKLSNRTATASNRALGAASGNIVSSYGGLYSGAGASAMGAAEATGAQAVTAAEAGLMTGKGLGRAGRAAMEIQQAGVQEAQAAAQYALSQAAIARAQADAQEVARMQYQLDLEKMRQTGAAIGSVYPGIEAVSNLAGDIAAEARRALSAWYSDPENEGKVPVLSDIHNAVVNQLMLSSAEEAQLASLIIRQLYTQNAWERGPNTRTDVVDIVVDAVMLSYAGDVKGKDRSAIRNYVEDRLKAIYSASAPPPPPPPPPSSTSTTPIGDPNTGAYATSPQALNPTESATVTMPSFEENFAAGVELYMLIHPQASRADAESVVSLYLSTGGPVPNYVEELANYKAR